MTYTPTILGSGLAGYSFLTRTRDTQQELLAKSPDVARDTAKFTEKLKDIQSADELMEDRALLKVALGAFGLDEDIDNRAFIKKILESDLADTGSLANRLADKRYLALAKTFNFASEDGAQLPDARSADDITEKLAAVQTADDLLADRSLLRATLSTLGLEEDMNNTYFLKQVLESDAADESSFVNQLSDARYAELSTAFGLAAKTYSPDTIYGFSQRFADRVDAITDTDALFEDEELLSATLSMFGLDNDIYRTDFLTAVLNSDLQDDASVANQQEDPRYLSLAKLFDFTDHAEASLNGEPFTSTFQSFVATVASREAPLEKPGDLFSDIPLMLGAFDFFDFPKLTDRVAFANRVLSSDLSDPTSLANVHPDPRVHVFASAFEFKEPDTRRSYPPGFAEQIVENYLDRQFEIQIGNADPTMRIALSFERDLDTVNASGASNNSRWFSVMASNPLREVFETVFSLPDSFGTLDIDQQLTIFKKRATQVFGTNNLSELGTSESLDEIRRQYLARSALSDNPISTSANVVMTLLAGASLGN